MIETKYIVVKTNNGNYSNVENNQTFEYYHIAMQYRDKKREIEYSSNERYGLKTVTSHLHRLLEIIP